MFYHFFIAAIQQQSDETCRAIDRVIAGRNPVIGTCVRDSTCTMVSCTGQEGNNIWRVFPCTNPIVVHLISTVGLGVNINVTSSRIVTLSTIMTASIFLTQIEGGIRFGVKECLTLILADPDTFALYCSYHRLSLC